MFWIPFVTLNVEVMTIYYQQLLKKIMKIYLQYCWINSSTSKQITISPLIRESTCHIAHSISNATQIHTINQMILTDYILYVSSSSHIYCTYRHNQLLVDKQLQEISTCHMLLNTGPQRNTIQKEEDLIYVTDGKLLSAGSTHHRNLQCS